MMKLHPILRSFINTGLDIYVSSNYVDLLKSYNPGLVQRLVHVTGHLGQSDYYRLQWVNPNDSKENNIKNGFKEIQKREENLAKSMLALSDLTVCKRNIDDLLVSLDKQKIHYNATLSTYKKNVSFLENDISNLRKEIRRLKMKIYDKTKEKPNNQHLINKLRTLQKNLQDKIKKLNETKKKLNAKENLDMITVVDKQIEDAKRFQSIIEDKLKSAEEVRKTAQAHYNMALTEVYDYVDKYQNETPPSIYERGLHQNNYIPDINEYRRYRKFTKDCERHYRVIENPKTHNKIGVRTAVGQLITGVDIKHLFTRAEERSFSLEEIDYVLQHPLFVVDGGTTTYDGESFTSLKYVTATRAVVVTKSGVIKTCMNLPVSPPKCYSRWILRGWDYSPENGHTLNQFKQNWYRQHPQFIEIDKKADDAWFEHWKNEGFDPTQSIKYSHKNNQQPNVTNSFVSLDSSGQPRRDRFGQIIYNNQPEYFAAFKWWIHNVYIPNKKRQNPQFTFSMEEEYNKFYPQEHEFELARRNYLLNSEVSNYYDKKYKHLKGKAIDFDKEEFEFTRATLKTFIQNIKRQLKFT